MEFSKEEYLKQAKVILATFGSNLWRVLPSDFDHYFDGVDLDLAFGAGPTAITELDKLTPFFNNSFLDWFDKCYEYGINGIRHESDGDLGCAEDEDNLPFFSGLVGMEEFLSNNAPHGVYIKFALIQAVMEKVRCRAVLEHTQLWEHQGKMYLTDLAILADLDERSIRNIASAKKDEFPVVHKVGNRSLVDKAEAKQWLIKRGWKETIVLTNGFNPSKVEAGFLSVRDLISFIEASRPVLSDNEILVKEISNWAEGFAITKQLDVGLIDRWCDTCSVDKVDMKLAVFALKQKLELDEFRDSL